MSLSATDRIQSKAGTSGTGTAGTSGFTATLDSPTTGGTTLLIFIRVGGLVTLPDYWIQDQGLTGNLYVFRKPIVAAGETSWVFTSTSGTPAWVWRIEEWTGLDLISPVDGSANGQSSTTGQATISSGTTGTTSSADTAALCVTGSFRGTGSGATFPAGRSYTNGFAEVSYDTNGSGGGNGDMLLSIAEEYPGATGAFESSITYSTAGGGSLTSLSTYMCMLVYRAPVADVPWNQGQSVMVG